MSPEKRSEFLQGMRNSIPVIVGAGPFGVLFGALAVDNGMEIHQAVLMSATIYAGASQMVGIDLFGSKIAPWLIVLSIFAVNFRHVLYSATIGPKFAHFTFLQKALAFFLLVDPQFVEAERRSERSMRLSFSWYLGMAIPIYVCWVSEAAVGGYFGKMLGDLGRYGIDMLLPAYFMGMALEFRKREHWLSVVLTSGLVSVAAYLTVGSPWHVTIGAFAGILLAAMLAKSESETVPANFETEEP